MAAIITGFEKGWSNPSRSPYVLGRATCGHLQHVTLKPKRGRCMKCQAEVELASGGAWTTCTCGARAFTIIWWPDAHNEADYVTRIGDPVADCRECASEARGLAFVQGLDPADLQHARFKYGSYHFYRRDHASPTGVSLIGSVPATKAVDALLREKRISPLSPTERA